MHIVVICAYIQRLNRDGVGAGVEVGRGTGIRPHVKGLGRRCAGSADARRNGGGSSSAEIRSGEYADGSGGIANGRDDRGQGFGTSRGNGQNAV